MGRRRGIAACFAALALSGCATVGGRVPAGPEGSRLPDRTARQAIVVRPALPADFGAELTAWRRRRLGWVRVFDAMPAVVGRNGFAPPGAKAEGDGRTPSGVYRLERSFGYGETPPGRLPYRRAAGDDFWIDDPASDDYNRWVSGPTPAVSHERLRRDDDQYRYAVVVEYNTDPVVPGLGSAIFLHAWRGPGLPTAGCVAVSEEDLLMLMGWLDPRRKPAILLDPSQPGGVPTKGADR